MEFDTRFVTWKGSDNVLPDALSRQGWPEWPSLECKDALLLQSSISVEKRPLSPYVRGGVVNDLQTLCHPLTNFERFTLPPRTGRFINTLPCQNCIYLPNSNFQRNIIEVLPKVLYIMAEGKSRVRMCVSNCGCKCQFHLIFNWTSELLALGIGWERFRGWPSIRESPSKFSHFVPPLFWWQTTITPVYNMFMSIDNHKKISKLSW